MYLHKLCSPLFHHIINRDNTHLLEVPVIANLNRYRNVEDVSINICIIQVHRFVHFFAILIIPYHNLHMYIRYSTRYGKEQILHKLQILKGN